MRHALQWTSLCIVGLLVQHAQDAHAIYPYFEVTPDTVEQGEVAFTIDVQRAANGDITFTVTRPLPEPKAHLLYVTYTMDGETVQLIREQFIQDDGDATYTITLTPEQLETAQCDLYEGDYNVLDNGRVQVLIGGMVGGECYGIDLRSFAGTE